MGAYPNNDKQMYIERVKAHRLADELIAGIGWDGKKGCSVGCTVECYDHATYARKLGIPLVLSYLQDAIFEGLPLAERLAFPERFLSAIREGSDLSGVWPKFAIRMLSRSMLQIGEGNEEWRTNCRDSVSKVVSFFQSGSAEWDAAAASAAWAAARSAEWDAVRSAAAWAARSAAKAAAEAAARAARSAASASEAAVWAAESAASAARSAWASKEASAAESAAWAARSAEYTAQADDLIELVEEANK